MNQKKTQEALFKMEKQVVLVTLKNGIKIKRKGLCCCRGNSNGNDMTLIKNYVYIPLAVAQELLVRKKKMLSPASVSKLDDYRYANQVRDNLQTESELWTTMYKTWEDARKTFLTAEMERRVMAFILFFIIVVAGFHSLAFTMIVLEKSKDIGV